MSTKIISLVNQKGGVGKTTSSINIASALSKREKKVLLIDLDPQGNCSTGLGVKKELFHSANIYHCLLGSKNIKDCIYSTSNDLLDLMPSDINLSATELDLANEMARESRLKNSLEEIKGVYDIIIIDCPPSLSLLTINALNASTHYIVPMLPEMYSLEGFSHIQRTTQKVQQFLGNPIINLGVLLTMVDKRNNLHKEMSTYLRNNIKSYMFENVIPRNIKLSEAVNFGKSIFDYNKKAIGALAYELVAEELLNQVGEDKEDNNE
jgi:chromosome partitioning protein